MRCQLFYTTFMRLFAFTLPVTTLFRFWDLLLADANRPDLAEGKPARHALIDLAFGGMGQGVIHMNISNLISYEDH